MHPIVFSIEILGKDINFYSYGMMLMFSFLFGWAGAYYFMKKEGYGEERPLHGLVGATIGALVLARLLFVITNWNTFAGEFPISVVNFKKYDGMVAYGGYLGGSLGSYLVLRHYGWKWLQYADVTVPWVGFGLFLTRIGCLLAGCDYGKPTDLPWGLSFPKDSYAFNRHVREHLISSDALDSLPVHPTQIYESLAGLAFFFILIWFFKNRRRYSGHTLALFFILYGVFRFCNEFLRGDTGRGEAAGVSTSQWIAILTIGWAVWLLTRKYPIQTPEQLQAALAKSQPSATKPRSKGKKGKRK
jgi:phosphatidylglycerol:prolipoprotein diacylglycerol transferase